MMNEITLYDNETAYEREYAYAVLDEGKLRITAGTSEHAPGGHYSLTYSFDEKNTAMLARHLFIPTAWLLQKLKWRFSGCNGIKRFQTYCQSRNIVYSAYAG